MKTGIELISEERRKGYDNLKEENFASDFKVINAGVQFVYANNSKLKSEVLIKAGALIAAELDRMQSEIAIKYCEGEDDIAFDFHEANVG